MNSNKKVNFLVLIIFVGIILSGTIYFGITAIMNEISPTISEVNEQNQLNVKDEFNNLVYKKSEFQQLISFVKIKLFQQTDNNNIIIGKEDFLFQKESDNYNYLSDFNGEYAYTPNQLDEILIALTKRQLAYNNQAIDYILAVIPNSQTVYNEYMPSYLGKISDNTRLKQLGEHLNLNKQNSTINFIDLTDVLNTNKSENNLYNNTENSLNSLGAYYAYSEIYNHMPDKMKNKNKLDTTLVSNISTSYTEGKKLAIDAEAENIIKNKTLSLTNNSDILKYSILESNSVVETTYVKRGYKNEIPINPSIMIEFRNEADKINFMPYFSNTYGSASYKNNYFFTPNIIKAINPQVVIQIVREDELYTLLDNEINLSYNLGMKPGDDPTTTMMPIMLGKSEVDKKTTCIMGTVEAGSVLTISGDTIETRTETAQYERFFIDVKMEKGQSDTISIIAKTPDKNESTPLTVNVSYNEGTDTKTVIVGKDSQLHYPDTLRDFWGINLFDEGQLKAISRRHDQKVKKIRQATGKNTKYIYVIPPNPFTIYPETAPDDIKAGIKSENSKLKQFIELMKNNEDVIVIDLAPVMVANKNLGKLYYQTDTHWNTLGAYFGYRELMNIIAKDFPTAAPYDISQYNISQEYGNAGDLVNFLGQNQEIVNEYITFCKPNFKSKARIFPLGNEKGVAPPVTEAMRSKIDDPDLPTAIMMRDSFGSNLVGFLGENFSDLASQAMWDHNLNYDLVKEIKPDYIIHALVERNMDIVLQ